MAEAILLIAEQARQSNAMSFHEKANSVKANVVVARSCLSCR
jgi:hypothetical protein